MTLPDERTRSILYARRFLWALLDPKQTPKVPRNVRQWAYRALRHYPSKWEIRQLAENDNMGILTWDKAWNGDENI